MLWGVGPATAARLHERGIHLVGHLAQVPEPALKAMLGRSSGAHLHAIAHNRDPRPVRARRRRRSLGSQSALGARRRSDAELDAVLVALVDRVTRRMRSAGLVGRTITLRLRFGDYSRASRSRSLAQATAATAAVLRTVRALFADARPLICERGLTLLGLTFTNLGHVRDGVQLALALESGPPVALDEAVDSVRQRYGPAGRDPGLAPAWGTGPGARAEPRRAGVSASIAAVTAIDIDTPHGPARAHLHHAPKPSAALVLGHGAGGGVAAPDLVAATEEALQRGVSVALVEQPYRVAGRKSSPPAKQLDAAWLAVTTHLADAELEGLPLIAGGRSAGARVACRTAAASGAIAVLCLAFPLQPPPRKTGKQSDSRQSELDAVTVPLLVVQGVKDRFGMPASAGARTVVQIEGNHSLRGDPAALREAIGEWLSIL